MTRIQQARAFAARLPRLEALDPGERHALAELLTTLADDVERLATFEADGGFALVPSTNGQWALVPRDELLICPDNHVDPVWYPTTAAALEALQ